MDTTRRYTLREVYEAAAAYDPDITYKVLYFRLYDLRKRGKLPKSATADSLTWEQARMILLIQRRRKQGEPRKEAVSVLRSAMRTDGIY